MARPQCFRLEQKIVTFNRGPTELEVPKTSHLPHRPHKYIPFPICSLLVNGPAIQPDTHVGIPDSSSYLISQ